jgi:hypothetical protein
MTLFRLPRDAQAGTQNISHDLTSGASSFDRHQRPWLGQESAPGLAPLPVLIRPLPALVMLLPAADYLCLLLATFACRGLRLHVAALCLSVRESHRALLSSDREGAYTHSCHIFTTIKLSFIVKANNAIYPRTTHPRRPRPDMTPRPRRARVPSITIFVRYILRD